MRIAGIVAEYNPFHSGHQYHIAATRERLGGDCGVVCVMSGNWVQRGECAITDKWTRAGAALRSGADLVLELPTVWAAASAESFARGAVSALAASGVVDALSFGSESGDTAPLRAVAECLDSEIYRAGLRRFLDEGMPFAACRQAVVAGILGREAAGCLSNPNDNLGVEYLRALPPQMEAVTVRRVGADHDGALEDGYASASSLRDWMRTGKIERGSAYLPEPWRGDITSMEWCERAILARLRSMTLADAERLPDSGEGLAARLLSAAAKARDLTELYDLAKTKRYAHARIRRLVLWAFLGLTAEDRPPEVPYLRVLGMNERGRAILKVMREKASAPVLTKPAHAKRLPVEGRRLFELEARCTDLYGLCFAEPRPGGAEWTTNPVVADSAAGRPR
ncbi:MAG: nucleotidyltransferase [Clostridia bacterium]|nr:nucleotidyltransferase [Clostridia bacterium]